VRAIRPFPYSDSMSRVLLAALLVVVHARVATAQIVDDRACDNTAAFAAIEKGWAADSSGFREWVTRPRYERIVSAWECRRIVYLSEGLRIVGFIYRPVNRTTRHPAIIVNRGGTGDFGKMHPTLQRAASGPHLARLPLRLLGLTTLQRAPDFGVARK